MKLQLKKMSMFLKEQNISFEKLQDGEEFFIPSTPPVYLLDDDDIVDLSRQGILLTVFSDGVGFCARVVLNSSEIQPSVEVHAISNSTNYILVRVDD